MDRPQVFLNCATSHDGRLAAADGSPVRFSDDVDMARVHRMRAECDAILVGIGTVLADDPHLTVKTEHMGEAGEHPLRVVLDAHGRTPPGARVLDDAAPTLIMTGAHAPPVPGAQQVRLSVDGDNRLDLEEVLATLAAFGIRSVMVEGGEEVLRSFLDAGLWDRFTLYQAPGPIGGDGPRLWDATMDETGLTGTSEAQGTGTLWTFNPR